MSREEDLIRSTTHAIASTVREVPPLQLEPAADELSSAAPPRGGSARRHGPRSRHRGTWLVPATAAAAVVALAVSLVIVKGIQNGPAVPKSPATSTTGSDSVPPYYVALPQVAGNAVDGTARDGIVVGDSLTGQTLATFTPPAQTSFQAVKGAADDRTFVVEAVRSSTGEFSGPLFADGATMTASWFEVLLAPGTADPARLVPLPVKPQSWVIPKQSAKSGKVVYAVVSGGEVTLPMALSSSGQELAIGDTPVVAGRGEVEVKVVSVATGQLLHDWTTADPSVSAAALGDPSGLTWIDEDRALAVAIVNKGHQPYWEELLRLNATGPASGDLIADSQVIASWPESGSSTSCFAQDTWVPFVTADGNTAACWYYRTVGKSLWQITFRTDTLTAGTPAVDQSKIDYQFTHSSKNLFTPEPAVLWADPSGDTLIAAWGFEPKVVNSTLPSFTAHIGVISHGTFTPLRLPSTLTTLGPPTPWLPVIAW